MASPPRQPSSMSPSSPRPATPARSRRYTGRGRVFTRSSISAGQPCPGGASSSQSSSSHRGRSIFRRVSFLSANGSSDAQTGLDLVLPAGECLCGRPDRVTRHTTARATISTCVSDSAEAYRGDCHLVEIVRSLRVWGDHEAASHALRQRGRLAAKVDAQPPPRGARVVQEVGSGRSRLPINAVSGARYDETAPQPQPFPVRLNSGLAFVVDDLEGAGGRAELDVHGLGAMSKKAGKPGGLPAEAGTPRKQRAQQAPARFGARDRVREVLTALAPARRGIGSNGSGARAASAGRPRTCEPWVPGRLRASRRPIRTTGGFEHRASLRLGGLGKGAHDGTARLRAWRAPRQPAPGR